MRHVLTQTFLGNDLHETHTTNQLLAFFLMFYPDKSDFCQQVCPDNEKERAQYENVENRLTLDIFG